MELTADGRAVGEGGVDLWVHVDGQLLHLHDLGVPRLHPLLHPVGEGVADHAVDDVGHELLGQLHDLLG